MYAFKRICVSVCNCMFKLNTNYRKLGREDPKRVIAINNVAFVVVGY